MNTRSVNSAAGVILAALQQNRTPAGIALASVSSDAVQVAERAVGELKREHGISGGLQRLLDKAYDDLTGANLSLYEEELETARLRLALRSAQRGRREARARVAALLAERHATNEALADVTVAQRAADRLTRLLTPTQALREPEPGVAP
ncbi:hypothetical protein EASAB2608_06268 [Streptomyces sp. EAS-AB2608]|uniref:hypothetical protein n=1 Tax=Streptomyces sp. EAS-AB2608 TaxID=2779671 RepID=UPI001BEF59CC|nr:hypothetical protein [Streptomyces sp. EAS-AB2608]BCM70934.1 hypothetical protein EASAB2608_06268 [Streptomyces sp. EAS-AB2608]